jgi:hypothetical protein
MYDLGIEFHLFMEFADDDWISDFAFPIDMIRQLNHINIQIHGKDQLVGRPPSGFGSAATSVGRSNCGTHPNSE